MSLIAEVDLSEFKLQALFCSEVKGFWQVVVVGREPEDAGDESFAGAVALTGCKKRTMQMKTNGLGLCAKDVSCRPANTAGSGSV